MFKNVVIFVLLLLNLAMTFLLGLSSVDLLINDQYFWGIWCILLASINAYCVYDAIETLQAKFKECKND